MTRTWECRPLVWPLFLQNTQRLIHHTCLRGWLFHHLSLWTWALLHQWVYKRKQGKNTTTQSQKQNDSLKSLNVRLKQGHNKFLTTWVSCNGKLVKKWIMNVKGILSNDVLRRFQWMKEKRRGIAIPFLWVFVLSSLVKEYMKTSWLEAMPWEFPSFSLWGWWFV